MPSEAVTDEVPVVSPADEVREALIREHAIRVRGLFHRASLTAPVVLTANSGALASAFDDHLTMNFYGGGDDIVEYYHAHILRNCLLTDFDLPDYRTVDQVLISWNLPDEQLSEDEGTGDYRLPLAGDFTPSSDLLALWRENVEATVTQPRSAFGLSDLEASTEFSRALTSLIGSLGQEFRYAGGPRQKLLAADGRFDPLIQVELCERFLIVPDRSANFLNLLESEMFLYLSEGGRFSGGWGNIGLSKPRTMFFLLNGPRFQSEAGFIRAKELK